MRRTDRPGCGSPPCSACAPRCGDGIIAGSETCESSTGCSAPEICNPFCSACTTCGNGVVDGSEACDGTLGCPGGAYCRGDCSGCFTRCGDGIVGGSEVCDGSAGCDSGICRSDCSGCTPCPPTVAVIPAEGGTFSGTTTGGTTVLFTACGGAGGPQRTFQWTPAVSGTASIQTCGSSYDTVLYIREGGCSGSQLACNDDSCGTGSWITPSVTAGQTYTIVVDGYRGANGAFVLTVTPPAQ